MKLIQITWPPITDSRSASNATRFCYFTVITLSIISGITLTVSYLWITLKLQKAFTINQLLLGTSSIILFAFIGIMIKKNSRVAALMPMLLMLVLGTGPNIIIGVVEISKIVAMQQQFKPIDFGSWYGIASAIVLTTIYVNGIRGAFSYHKYMKLSLPNQRIQN